MKNILVLLSCCLYTLSAKSQYLIVQETDQSGTSTILGQSRQPIDINSTLNITMQMDSIFSDVHTALQADGNLTVDSLLRTLRMYRSYIARLDSAVQIYSKLFDPPRDHIELSTLKKALQQRAAAGLTITRLFPVGSRFQQRREAELAGMENKGSNERFRIIMRVLAEEMDYLEDDLAAIRKEAGFIFQLGAWSVTNRGKVPLHLQGFDMLPEGEYYAFERNQLYLTEAQKNELESLNSFFKDVEASDLFNRVADVIPGLAASLLEPDFVTSQIHVIKVHAQSLVTTTLDEKNKLVQRVDRAVQTWNSLRSELENIKTRYAIPSGESPIQLLTTFMNDVSVIGLQVKTLESEVASIITEIKFDVLGEEAITLKAELEGLASLVGAAADQLINHARESYHLAVYGREINTAALELSEEVLKLAVNEIPVSTDLDLHFTGKREPGDLIVLKAVLRKGDDTKPFKEDVRKFPILNALPHVHMSVVYAFAKPAASGTNWKGGPLVSVLYKFKSRSVAYRNLFDPGIGLHAASYDFNNDDTPEFAGGMVVSMFKDYLQSGWGFNFNANCGYWFAGLRIPIPTSPLALQGAQP
jgi:hypothetical protein